MWSKFNHPAYLSKSLLFAGIGTVSKNQEGCQGVSGPAPLPFLISKHRMLKNENINGNNSKERFQSQGLFWQQTFRRRPLIENAPNRYRRDGIFCGANKKCPKVKSLFYSRNNPLFCLILISEINILPSFYFLHSSALPLPTPSF